MATKGSPAKVQKRAATRRSKARRKSVERMLECYEEPKIPTIQELEDALPDTDTGLLPADNRFMRELVEVAEASTTTDVHKKEAKRGMELGIFEGTRDRLYRAVEPPKVDTILVTTEDQLEAAASGPFLLIYGPREHSLVSPRNFNIEKQVDHLLSIGRGLAWLPALDDALQEVDARDVWKAVYDPTSLEPSKRIMNVLDIANTSSLTFLPPTFFENDLSQIIRRKKADHWGKDGFSEKDIADYKPDLWTILTVGPTVSPFHVDKFGRVTYIVGIDGEKWWYSTSDGREDQAKFYMNGPRSVKFNSSIVARRVQRGDLLIQAPGNIHAVITPDKSLLSGGFCWTAEHLARTFEVILLFEQDLLHGNEDTSVRDYQELRLIVEHLDALNLLTPAQKNRTHDKVYHLLLHFGCIRKDQKSGGYVRSIKKKPRDNRGKEPLNDARHNFFYACVEWWMRNYTE